MIHWISFSIFRFSFHHPEQFLKEETLATLLRFWYNILYTLVSVVDAFLMRNLLFLQTTLRHNWEFFSRIESWIAFLDFTIVTKIPHWWSDDDRLDKLNLGITFHRVPFEMMRIRRASFATYRLEKIPFGTYFATSLKDLKLLLVVESSGFVKQIPEKNQDFWPLKNIRAMKTSQIVYILS